MSIAAVCGRHRVEIGTGSFFKAFFSTVFVALESPSSWGSRFPVLMVDLYRGRVPASKLGELANELRAARAALTEFPPASVVWDFEDLGARPPWGDNISPTITSLGNYFVTSEGKDLIEQLIATCEASDGRGTDLVIQ